MITKKVTVRLIGGDQHAICHEAFDFGTESLSSIQVEAFYENHDQLRAMAKKLMKVADECKEKAWKETAAVEKRREQIDVKNGEIGELYQHIENSRFQIEKLTNEVNELSKTSYLLEGE